MATELTFEKAMTRLEYIVTQLESGKCTLDQSLKLFEEGTKLTAYCSKALKTAEQKILRLTSEDIEKTEDRRARRQNESEDAEPESETGKDE
ncbi:MAG: exodeoxyribonuclease VII small subunit [Oscillospiraceae bacterium]|jgi:exodeoxyribonuclease VII small subunit|nr:exodeoxyribonuclease VII small subunit [Oscillospiraceae bacterium]